MAPAATRPMSGLRITFLAIAMFVLLMTLFAKTWVATAIVVIAIALVAPWPFLFETGPDGVRQTRGDLIQLRKWMGRIAVILSVVALFVMSSAWSETPEGKAAMAKHDQERRIEQAMEEARDRAEEAREQAEKESGLHCLSQWNGAFPALVEAVKPSMRNPDSFEHIETRITRLDSDGNHNVLMSFRAQNGFGGMNVESAFALVRGSDCRMLEWRIMG